MEDSDQNQSDIPKFKSIDSLESLKDKLTEFDKENLSEEITQLINLLKEITSMETIEQYFENDKKTMEYFVSKFCQKIISSILESNNLFSEEIELKALELLYHFFNLFLKFHKNENYSKLFEKLRLIISPEKNLFLFPKPTTENNLLKYKKHFSCFQYNKENCSSFINTKLYSANYQKDDKVDILISNKHPNKNLDKKCWVRGTINKIEDGYYVDYGEKNETKKISINSYQILNEGAMTKDWDWRISLKTYDLVDYFDGVQWKPSTIIECNDSENGIKMLKVGQRIFKEKCENFEELKVFWKKGKFDENNESYGDGHYLDKEVICYSKCIQKLNTFSEIQKKNLDYIFPQTDKEFQNNDKNVEIYQKTLNLEKEDKSELIPKLFLFENKNYIIAKTDNFSYYYASLLKKIADENNFDNFINILNGKPNEEEIYTIFYILLNAYNYLHPEYFEKNKNEIKKSFIDFIDDVNGNNLKIFHKDFIENGIKLLELMFNEKFDDLKNDLKIIIDVKFIKSNILNLRLRGISDLNQLIEKNNHEEKLNKTIKENKIIQEIYNSNYHSQLIINSQKILQILINNDSLTENDIKLIWSFTKKGDQETQNGIINIFHNLNLKKAQKDAIIKEIIENKTNIDKKEIDLVFSLFQKGEKYILNDNIYKLFCDCFFGYLLKNIEKLIELIDKLNELIFKDKKCLKYFLENLCLSKLKNNNFNENQIQIYDIVLKVNDKYSKEVEKCIKFDELFPSFKNQFNLYIQKVATAKNQNIDQNKDQIIINNYTHEENIRIFKNYLLLMTKNNNNFPLNDERDKKMDEIIGLLTKNLMDKNINNVTDNKVFYELMNEYLLDKEYSNGKKLNAILDKLFQHFKNNPELADTDNGLFFCEKLFLEINYLNLKLEYSSNNNQINFNNFKCSVLELDHYLDFEEILWHQNNKELIKKKNLFLYDLFKENKSLEKLCQRIRSRFDLEDSKTMEENISFYKFIFQNIENNALLEVKPHFALSKKNIIKIIFEIDNTEELYCYGNTTIIEILNYAMNKHKLPINRLEIFIIHEKGSKTKLNENNYHSTLIELKLNHDPKKKLKITKKKVIKDKLIENDNLTPKFEKILEIWFYKFTKNEKQMNKDAALEYLKSVTGIDFPKDSMKIVSFLKNNGKNESYLTMEEFKEFYKNACKKQMNIVWDNIKKMNYSEDLIDKSTNLTINTISKKELPRFYLSNSDDPNIFLLKKLKQKYAKYELSGIIDFILLLSTNEKKYNKLLADGYFFDNDNSCLEQYVSDFYSLIILESILIDNELNCNADKYNNKFKIIPNIYLPFDSKENLIKKQEFVTNFIENDKFKNLINFSENIFNFINKENKFDFKGMKIMIKCCKKSLKIINNILRAFYEIPLDDNFDDNLDIYYIKYKSIKQIFMKTNCSEKITDSKLYEKFVHNILKFINLYYKRIEDNNKCDLIINLLKKSFSSIILILLINENLYNELNKNNEINELMKDVLVDVIVDTNFKNSDNKFLSNIFYQFFKTKYCKKYNQNFLIFLFDLNISICEKLLITNPTKDKHHDYINIFKRILFFNVLFSSIFEIIAESNYDKISSKVNNFIRKIYDYLYKQIKEIENEKILSSKEIIIGFIYLLLKLLNIKKNIELKKEFIAYKINNELTLYELIIQKIFSITKNKYEQLKEYEKKKQSILNNDENKYISFDELNIKPNDSIVFKKNKDLNEIISICNKYITWCLESNFINKEEEINKLLNLVKDFNSIENLENSPKNSRINSENSEKVKKSRKICEFVGIKNLGSLCYMNSIIQQLYMIPSFRYSIMSVDDKKEPIKSDYLDDDNLLHQLQRMFTYLYFSNYEEFIPKNFCYSFKDWDNNPINPRNQQDAHEFYNNFCDKIENSLQGTNYSFLINNLFNVKTCSVLMCDNCENKKYNFDNSYNLSLEIKNLKNIYESLDKLISEEKIDDYNCEKCKKKVVLIKKTFLVNLSNILIIHLKRLNMNYTTGNIEKINSYLEFPEKLNLKKYFIENNNENLNNNEVFLKKEDYYEYELKGVNIHTGSANGGHYYSLINVNRETENIEDKKEKWYKFDDPYVTQFDKENKFKEECFGGEINGIENHRSAYLLFYELIKKKPIKINLNNKNDDVDIINLNENNINDYNITKFDNNLKEEDLCTKIFFNNNSYYKYISYNKIPKLISKKYYLEVLDDNELSKNYSNNSKLINLDNNIIQLIIECLDSIFKSKNNLIDYNTYKNLLTIILDATLSTINTISVSDLETNKNIKNYIKDGISKSISPLISKNICLNLKDEEKKELFYLIYEKLFESNNLEFIFKTGYDEIIEKIIDVLIHVINKKYDNINSKILDSIIEIITKTKIKQSKYIYKFLFELIKLEDRDNLIQKDVFMTLYYKIEKMENIDILNYISDILIYLSETKDIISSSETITELKAFFIEHENDMCFILFDKTIKFFILLLKKLEFNDNNFTNKFNYNFLQKLFLYSSNDKIKKKKLLKLLYGLLEINDAYTPDRIFLFLGHPTYVIKENLKSEGLDKIKFGFKLVCGDKTNEFIEYISFNHLAKDRCILAQLFPSYYKENKNESDLDSNEINELIYELLSLSLGVKNKSQGNYFLFKVLYLMQTRNLEYKNLYDEMIFLLKNEKNKKYDLENIQKNAKICIQLIEYEMKNTEFQINVLTNKKSIEDNESNNNSVKKRPPLPESMEHHFIITKTNTDFMGFLIDIIPNKIISIEITRVASSKNLNLYKFEYFTTYKNVDEILNKKNEENNDKKNYIDERKNKIKKENIHLIDYSSFKDKKNNFIDFLLGIDEKLNDNKQIVIENVENEKFDGKDNVKIKSTLIRYFIYSKVKKIVVKASVNKNLTVGRDTESNFCLPSLIYDIVDANEVVNFLNIYRIKEKYEFLKDSDFGVSVNCINAEKYLREYIKEKNKK